MAKTTKVRRGKVKASKPSQEIVLPGRDDLNEPPDNFQSYCTCIFGEKGIGKTSLAAQFEDYLVLQGEPRRRNLRIRQFSLPVKSVKEIKREARGADDYLTPWEIAQQVIQQALQDDSIKGLAIDTIDRLYDACMNHWCYTLEIKDPGEMNDYGATWRGIKDDFCDTLNAFLYDEQEKGLMVISHAHYREVESRDGSEGYQLLVPTCGKGAYDWVKQACDFAFYYGYYRKQRALYLRGNDLIWSACGSPENFLDPQSNPLEVISMGTNPQEAHQNLLAGFANEMENFAQPEEEDEEEETEEKKPRRRKKRS